MPDDIFSFCFYTVFFIFSDLDRLGKWGSKNQYGLHDFVFIYELQGAATEMRTSRGGEAECHKTVHGKMSKSPLALLSLQWEIINQ